MNHAPLHPDFIAFLMERQDLGVALEYRPTHLLTTELPHSNLLSRPEICDAIPRSFYNLLRSGRLDRQQQYANTSGKPHPGQPTTFPVNAIQRSNVKRYVARIAVLALLALPLFAADDDLSELLRDVEKHYNGVRTLQVSFEETYRGTGRPMRSEAGELYLRKPGKMRWEYTKPAGKLFMSDGKQVYYYSPITNRAEKVKMKQTEDLRAPLAFLLGRLDFDKDFKDFKSRKEGPYTVISAEPKSDRLPYKHVEFSVSPQNEIRKLVVTGQDNALLTFNFQNERMNPRLADSMFKFRLPPGAQWLETGTGSEGELQ